MQTLHEVTNAFLFPGNCVLQQSRTQWLCWSSPGSVPVDEKVMYGCLASLLLELPAFATHIWRRQNARGEQRKLIWKWAKWNRS